MKNLLSKKGFTLIEILIVVVIMAILATGGVNSYNNGVRQQSVKNARIILISEIEEMRNLALSNVKFEDSNYKNFGIQIQKTDPYVVLFVDKNENKTFDANEDYRESDFPDGVKITSIKKDDTEGPTVIILFSRPRAEVLTSFKELKVKITDDSGILSRCLQFNKISGFPEKIKCN